MCTLEKSRSLISTPGKLHKLCQVGHWMLVVYGSMTMTEIFTKLKMVYLLESPTEMLKRGGGMLLLGRRWWRWWWGDGEGALYYRDYRDILFNINSHSLSDIIAVLHHNGSRYWCFESDNLYSRLKTGTANIIQVCDTQEYFTFHVHGTRGPIYVRISTGC